MMGSLFVQSKTKCIIHPTNIRKGIPDISHIKTLSCTKETSHSLLNTRIYEAGGIVITQNGWYEVYPNLFLNTNTDVVLAEQIHYIIKRKLIGIFHLAGEDIINHKDFYDELIVGLGYHEARMQDNLEEKGYFALLPNRNNELPERLRITNDFVVKYLINNIIIPSSGK